MQEDVAYEFLLFRFNVTLEKRFGDAFVISFGGGGDLVPDSSAEVGSGALLFQPKLMVSGSFTASYSSVQ